MNLDEVPTYIPNAIAVMTDEQHARVELQRYYSGNDLERAIERSLRLFKINDFNIKEFDYVEDNIVPPHLDGNNSCIRLVWKKRLLLQ